MRRRGAALRWAKIGPLDAIPRRGARVVETDRGPVAVFRTSENQVFALDDRCPRSGGPLSCGIVHGHYVTCPLHATDISLETGKAEGQPGPAVLRHAVEVMDGQVYLAISSGVRSQDSESSSRSRARRLREVEVTLRDAPLRSSSVGITRMPSCDCGAASR